MPVHDHNIIIMHSIQTVAGRQTVVCIQTVAGTPAAAAIKSVAGRPTGKGRGRGVTSSAK